MEPEERDKVTKLLSSWGLKNETVEKFVENEMDIDAIQHMDEASMASLLPLHGIRIKFKRQHETWVKSLAQGAAVNLFAPDGSASTSGDTGDQIQPKTVTSNAANEDSVDLNDNVSIGELNKDLKETDDDLSDSIVIVLENKADNVDKSVAGGMTVEDDVDHKQVKVESVPSKMEMKSQHTLDTILFKNSKAKDALKQYDINGEFVRDSQRDNLVDGILEYETNGELETLVSRDRLKHYAALIIERCPTESITTYFETYVNFMTKKTVARGKLVWRNYNRHRISKKYESNSGNSNAREGRSGYDVLANAVVDKKVQASLCWLELNRGDCGQWDEVPKHWQITSAARLKDLIVDEEFEEEDLMEAGSSKGKRKKSQPKKSLTQDQLLDLRRNHVDAYCAKFPVFEENNAYLLFEIDFKTLRPDVHALALFSEWGCFSTFVTEQVRRHRPDFLEDPLLSAGEKTITILRAVSHLLPVIPVSGPKKGKKTWRPTREEAADAFVLVVDTMLSLEEGKEKKREILRKHRCHMQPFVCVIGPIDNPTQYLVCINEFFYEVGSVLQAVDVTFKSFYALNTSYPAEAEQTWQFLQRAVYGFTTTEDKHFTGVNTVIKNYERFKANRTA